MATTNPKNLANKGERTAFERLPKEKQERILNASLNEFTRFGYKKASTDNIVSAASIGKGMLFHYFGSKKGLLDYCVDYALSTSQEYFNVALNELGESDFFDRLKSLSKLKLKVYIKHREVISFLGSVSIKSEEFVLSKEAKQKLDEFEKDRQSVVHRLMGEISAERLRKDLAPARLIQHIWWSIDGYTRSFLSALSDKSFADIDLTPMFLDFDNYVDELKTLYYTRN